MRTLIIGESGERPWIQGSSSRKLWSWFGVHTYEAFEKFATLDNVSRVKGDKHFDPMHYAKLCQLIDEHDLVFLVGRHAQKTLYREMEPVLWVRGKYIGLPHPSGLNHQLNTLPDETIRRFVCGILKLFECMPDRPLDVPKVIDDVE
jgi:hypothetical protein